MQTNQYHHQLYPVEAINEIHGESCSYVFLPLLELRIQNPKKIKKLKYKRDISINIVLQDSEVSNDIPKC